MNRLFHYCTLAIALSNPFVAVASEEGVLRLGTFQIASPDLGQFGPVVVSGELDTKQFVSLKVQAFGREQHWNSIGDRPLLLLHWFVP